MIRFHASSRARALVTFVHGRLHFSQGFKVFRFVGRPAQALDDAREIVPQLARLFARRVQRVLGLVVAPVFQQLARRRLRRPRVPACPGRCGCPCPCPSSPLLPIFCPRIVGDGRAPSSGRNETGRLASQDAPQATRGGPHVLGIPRGVRVASRGLSVRGRGKRRVGRGSGRAES